LQGKAIDLQLTFLTVSGKAIRCLFSHLD